MKHVSSAEYIFIPLENAQKIVELEEKIRKQDKLIRNLIKRRLKSRK